MLGGVIKIVQMTKISHREPCEYAFLQSMGYLRNILYRFLLITLNIDSIPEEVTFHQRMKFEQRMRNNRLGDSYTTTLTRLKAQKQNGQVLGIKVLM